MWSRFETGKLCKHNTSLSKSRVPGSHCQAGRRLLLPGNHLHHLLLSGPTNLGQTGPPPSEPEEQTTGGDLPAGTNILPLLGGGMPPELGQEAKGPLSHPPIQAQHSATSAQVPVSDRKQPRASRFYTKHFIIFFFKYTRHFKRYLHLRQKHSSSLQIYTSLNPSAPACRQTKVKAAAVTHCRGKLRWLPGEAATHPPRRALLRFKSEDNSREHKAYFPKGCNKSIFLACVPSRFSHLVRLNKQVSHSKENK